MCVCGSVVCVVCVLHGTSVQEIKGGVVKCFEVCNCQNASSYIGVFSPLYMFTITKDIIILIENLMSCGGL